MSAQIPETMLLSDLLKATGYDCPEELQGRTFAEATAGGDVQTNKASTIDVSAYTEPIVIKPDTDYESMKKNTVTLSNIPAVKTEEDLSVTENGEYTPDEGKTFGKVTVAVPQGVAKLFAWKGSSVIVYTKTETPVEHDDCYYPTTNPTTNLSGLGKSFVGSVGEGYITIGAVEEHKTRYVTGDITF